MSAIRLFIGCVMVCLGLIASADAQTAVPFTVEVPTGWTTQSLAADGALYTSGDAYVRIVLVNGGGSDQTLVKKVSDQIGAQWQNFVLDSHGASTFGANSGFYAFYTGVNPRGTQATMRIVGAPFGNDAWMMIISAPTSNFFNIKDSFKQFENSFAVHKSVPVAGEAPARTGDASSAGSAGGKMILRTVQHATSGTEAFRSGLAQTKGTFDSTPTLLSGVTSKNGSVTIAVFRAVQNKKNVVGLAVSAFDPAVSHFALMFDSPDHIKVSLKSMLNRVNQIADEGIKKAYPDSGGPTVDFAHFERAAAHVALKTAAFPDGTASIGIASGFTPKVMSGASFHATAEDGAFVKLLCLYSVLDPRGTIRQMQLQASRNAGGFAPSQAVGQIFLPYEPDPVVAWKMYVKESARLNSTPDPDPQVQHSEPMSAKAAGIFNGKNMSGTITIKGEKYAFTGSVLTSPAPMALGGNQYGTGYWGVFITILAAPIHRAEADFPSMIAMQKSLHVDDKALNAQTENNIARMNAETNRWLANARAEDTATRNATFQRAMDNAGRSRDAMDRSTAGFIQNIEGSAIVRNSATGTHVKMDRDYATALEKADPEKFNVVQIKDFVHGVDY